MTLTQKYQQLIVENTLESDDFQYAAITALDKLSLQLTSNQPHTSIKGLYLWGKVGRGKTMMMDMFYQDLTLARKQRIHFHHFMESVHRQLNQITGHQEPLSIVANALSKEVDVLCFDEFFVNDIGDAMLLAGLFKVLFAKGIVLVTTSNCQPEQLYRNGLLRERFLPTIDLLNHYCQVINVDGKQDHRLRQFSEYPYYFFPAEQYQQKMLACYQQLTASKVTLNELVSGNININYREINYLAKSDTTIWFDFFDLCSGPRSQRDYMVIAEKFNSVLLSNVPRFSGKLIPPVFSGIEDCYQRSGMLLGELRYLDDEARRFIALVDEFYEQKINLIVSAETDIFELYQAEQLAFEFERSESRLVEMQSAQYLSQSK